MGMNMAFNDAIAAENRDRSAGVDPVADPAVDPAVVKLQLRWKSAVQKVSTRLDAEIAHSEFDISEAAEPAAKLSEMLFHEDVVSRLDSDSHSYSHLPGGNAVAPDCWHAVRPSQVRKVDRQLARMQQAWLAPAMCGHFHLNDQPVEWQLSLPQAIVNPVVARIGHQPMAVDESAELASIEQISSDGLAESQATKPSEFSLTVGAESFLLNWIPAPWRTLGIDARYALLQVAIAPLVDALGLALGEHWHVVGLEDRRAKSEGGVRGSTGVNASSLSASTLRSTPDASTLLASDESSKIFIGVNFRFAGVAQNDTALLSVPEEWLKRFIVARRDAMQWYSMKHLLTAYPKIGEMRHALPVVIGELVLDARDVEQLEVGDVFFFAMHHGSLASFWNSKSVNARIDAPSAAIELTLDGVADTAIVRKISSRQFVHRASDFVEMDESGSPHFAYPIETYKTQETQETNMTHMTNTSSSSPVSTDALTVSDHLATLPIAITIEVGELSIPLSALSDITVGTTLSLAKPLDEHLLTIRANGLAIAFGELVMLDSEVGVRVKRLGALAASSPNRSDAKIDDLSTPAGETPIVAALAES
jgi:flagellar motor switch/type III secretory pathway protein FliN